MSLQINQNKLNPCERCDKIALIRDKKVISVITGTYPWMTLFLALYSKRNADYNVLFWVNMKRIRKGQVTVKLTIAYGEDKKL